MKALATIFAALALTACGGGSDSKDLFSIWTRDSDGATFDLSSVQFGTENYIYLFTQDGTKCACQLAVIGTQDSGSMALTRCISIPYNSSRNAVCESANGAGNYAKTDNVLTLTRGGASATFH